MFRKKNADGPRSGDTVSGTLSARYQDMIRDISKSKEIDFEEGNDVIETVSHTQPALHNEANDKKASENNRGKSATKSNIREVFSKKTPVGKKPGESRTGDVNSNVPATSMPPLLQDPLIIEMEQEVKYQVNNAWESLISSLQGAKQDSLILLIATSIIIPLFKRLKTSPILGFLLTGTLLGPSGLNWVRDVHMIDTLGELGIVFFLFEMGLELSLDRLMSMKKDVFGLGTSQFLITSLCGAMVALSCKLSAPAAVAIGGSLALSSSAFVLQLLKDKGAMGTRQGKASFGILLLQDIAVVPLLVVVELLASGGSGIARALGVAGTKAFITLTGMSLVGRMLLDKIFFIVAKSGSHEAFLSMILACVLLMSYVTQGIGLSNTLGAFLAGLLLSETRYRYQIEADIAPFRGLLLGFFFLTVGFSIDLPLLLREGALISKLVALLVVGKATIITVLCLLFGLSFAAAQQCGLLNAQGGEFAFVAFGLAERSGLISKVLCKRLLTTVALSMAVTPLLAEIGSRISSRLETTSGEKRSIFTPLSVSFLLLHAIA